VKPLSVSFKIKNIQGEMEKKQNIVIYFSLEIIIETKANSIHKCLSNTKTKCNRNLKIISHKDQYTNIKSILLHMKKQNMQLSTTLRTACPTK
jgi:hypothetical protein